MVSVAAPPGPASSERAAAAVPAGSAPFLEARVLRSAGTRVLRAAYRALPGVPGGRLRERLFQGLFRVRQRLYPSGTRVMGIASLPDGLRAWVNVAEREGGHRFFGVPYEPAERALVAQLLKAGDVVVDVGAHVGMYTLLASRLVGESGRVHAFEPVAELHAVLSANVALNGARNVRLHRLALSDRSGTVEMLVNRESGLSSLERTGRGAVLRTEPVPAATLDAHAAAAGFGRVRLLKIDVEGHEAEVLRGAEALLGREEGLVILCELEEKNYAPLGRSVRGVMAWMDALGYRAWVVGPARRSLRRWAGGGLDGASPNVVFAKESGPSGRTLAALEVRPGVLSS